VLSLSCGARGGAGCRQFSVSVVDVGNGVRYNEWLIHFTLLAPYMMF
jgi:hypothetical protein